MRIRVDSRVHIPASAPTDFTDDVRRSCTYKNPKRFGMERAKIPGWWAEPLTISTWDETPGGGGSIPRGAVTKLRTIARERGVDLAFDDDRLIFRPDPTWPVCTQELWPHQVAIVSECMRRENCLVKSATASGKSIAVLAFLARAQVKSLVLVHSRALQDQWVDNAVKVLGMSRDSIGTIGGGKKTIGEHLTIGIFNSVAKCLEQPDFAQSFGAVVVDEVHLAGAATFSAVADKFPARYRIGVSDDQRRKDGKEFLVHDLFGEVAVEVGYEEMVARGHVMDVEVLIVPTEFRADWYGIPGDEDDTKRPEFGRLLSEMAGDAARNAMVEKILASEISAGHQVLVFAREREHCRALATMASKTARTGHLIGGPDYRTEFERTCLGLKSGGIRVGVGTFQACGTGVDLPGVEIGIATTPVLANRQMFRQARGRVCRKPAGKTVARFYVLFDQHVFPERHLENAASWNASTFVWSEGAWTPIRAYLKARRKEKANGA